MTCLCSSLITGLFQSWSGGAKIIAMKQWSVSVPLCDLISYSVDAEVCSSVGEAPHGSHSWSTGSKDLVNHDNTKRCETLLVAKAAQPSEILVKEICGGLGSGVGAQISVRSPHTSGFNLCDVEKLFCLTILERINRVIIWAERKWYVEKLSLWL